jgi:hypothetical protein
MSPLRLFRTVLLAGCFCALAAPTLARDGYTHSPFHDRPVEVMQATALALVRARVEALFAVSQPAALAEETEKMRAHDLPLFLKSLRDADPNAAEALETAVEALLAQAEDGQPSREAGDRVTSAVELAGAALFSPPAAEENAFRAAVASLLLVSEAGLAEAYEEGADGDIWSYPVAWAMFQQVRAISTQISAGAGAQTVMDLEDTIERLAGLIAEADPPERFAADPEEGEAYAHRIVGLLEQAADADLYLSRDLPRALRTVRALAVEACSNGQVDIEGIAIAAFYHEDALENPLSILASDAQSAAEDAYEALLDAEGDAEEACGQLIAAFDAAASVPALGGAR